MKNINKLNKYRIKNLKKQKKPNSKTSSTFLVEDTLIQKAPLIFWRLTKILSLEARSNLFIFKFNALVLNNALVSCNYVYSLLVLKNILNINSKYNKSLKILFLNLNFIELYIHVFYYIKHLRFSFSLLNNNKILRLKNYKKKIKHRLSLKLTKLKLEKIIFNALNIKARIHLKSILKIVDSSVLKKVIPTNVRF